MVYHMICHSRLILQGSDTILPRMPEVRDLGVVFDSRFSFNERIEHLISSAMKALYSG